MSLLRRLEEQQKGTTGVNVVRDGKAYKEVGLALYP